jgi:hypothetical protein
MDVIGFLCASVQFHDSLGIRRACACSEVGFRSQNGDHTCVVLPKNSVLLVWVGNRICRFGLEGIFAFILSVFIKVPLFLFLNVSTEWGRHQLKELC